MFASVVANTILKNGEKEVSDYLSTNNDNVYKAINMLFDSVYISAHDVYSTNNIIIKALYSSELNTFERIGVHDELNRMVDSSPILESIYIYNKHQDILYSSLSTPKSPDTFYEENIFEKIMELQNKDTIFMVRDVSLENTFLNYDTKVITFVFSESSLDNSNASKMIVNISQSKLNNIIYKNFLPSNAMKSFIIDNNGVLISHGEEFLNNDMRDQGIIQDILDSESTKDNFIGTIDGQEYIISFTKSNKWGI